ncbi:hypothetical protein LSH36_309g01034 [Paralvinella palmiformis]|uniref:Ribosomal RNA-processing protein 42 n=1 Tax=Paralvinella palmiformis TaxID=53620 RepID=A0AAD9N2X5_9ANNE|nr:hypothetical protein LSH36_309g01034 [Paralvinella palmiformis]
MAVVQGWKNWYPGRLGYVDFVFGLDNLRNDGRGCEDYRSLDLETDVVSNSSGSSRVRLANTDILVGVKAELGEPAADKPSEGRIEFFVDCSANAAPEFEGRGGEDLALAISNTLAQSYDNVSSLDKRKLCVIPGHQCWVLYVDILLLECGGNLFDAASVAVKAALFNTKIPNLDVTKNEKGEPSLELRDDPFDCMRVDVAAAPCLVTLNKIGYHHVVDATREEESCTLARLIMGVTADGNVVTLKTEKSGSLDPESVFEMMQTGKRVGISLNNTLSAKLKQEETMAPKKGKKAFLR